MLTIRQQSQIQVEEFGLFVGVEAFHVGIGVGVAAHLSVLGSELLFDGEAEAADSVALVLKYTNKQTIHDVIKTCRRWSDGKATDEKLMVLEDVR